MLWCAIVLVMSVAPRWHGRVTADGLRIELQAATVYKRWLKTKAGKFVTVIVEELKKRRTNQQNAFWWAVVVPLFAEKCGYHTWEHDAVHDELLRVIFGERPGSHPAFPIRVSSRTLTTEQFNHLIEQAQILAAEKLNLIIPDPDPSWMLRRKVAPDEQRRPAPDSRQPARHH